MQLLKDILSPLKDFKSWLNYFKPIDKKRILFKTEKQLLELCISLRLKQIDRKNEEFEAILFYLNEKLKKIRTELTSIPLFVLILSFFKFYDKSNLDQNDHIFLSIMIFLGIILFFVKVVQYIKHIFIEEYQEIIEKINNKTVKIIKIKK